LPAGPTGLRATMEACLTPSPHLLEVDLETFAAAHEAERRFSTSAIPTSTTTAHVPGAVLIPLDQLIARRDEVPIGDPLYVICALGGRSLTATKALVEAGYRAVSVPGGTNGWIERGGAVVTGDDPLES
jgi:rhodanese-related sulfurtransferase